MSTTQTPDAKAAALITTGDEALAKNSFDSAKTSYDSAYTTLAKAYGYLSPTLVPALEKLVEAIYQKGAQGSSDTRKEICRYLKMILAIKQRQFGVRSKELIPSLEALVIFYDFDGAHMLAVEVLQRIDDINAANLEAGQEG